jgi:hypothetical protein
MYLLAVFGGFMGAPGFHGVMMDGSTDGMEWNGLMILELLFSCFCKEQAAGFYFDRPVVGSFVGLPTLLTYSTF